MGRIYHENEEWAFGDGDMDASLAIYKIRIMGDGRKIVQVAMGSPDEESVVLGFLTIESMDEDNTMLFSRDDVGFSLEQEEMFMLAFKTLVKINTPMPDLTPTDFYKFYLETLDED